MSASEERLFFLLQTAAHSLKKEADSRLKNAANLTTAQAAVLAVLQSRGPLSQRQLADTLMQRESAMTKMVERLTKNGQLMRKRSESDGRAWVLSLTKEGEAALRSVEQPFQEINSVLDEAFAGVDIKAAAAALKTVLARLSPSNRPGG